MFSYLDRKIQQVQERDAILKPRKRPFLQHIHYFRGFAIINIVMIHFLYPYLAEYVAQFRYPQIIVDLLFFDSTIYFVIISGFLFSYLAHKIRVKDYYRVKFKNVILPYIFITFVASLIKHRDLVMGMEVIPFLEEFVKHVFLGTVLIPFWYIPFIAVIFFIGPFFLLISEDKFRKLTLMLLFLPLLGTRPSIEITAWHFLYYTPIYMLGMLIARDYDTVLAMIARYKLALYLGVFVTSLVISYNLWLPENSYSLQSNILNGLFYVQKVSISFLLLRYFKRFDEKKINWLDYLAVYSFSIYFLHTLVQYPIQKILYLAPLRPYIDMAPVLYTVVVGIFLLFLTLIIAIVLEKILGRYSRMLIGT